MTRTDFCEMAKEKAVEIANIEVELSNVKTNYFNKMNKILSLWVMLLTCTFAFSQNDSRIAKSKTPLADIPQVVMPVQDNAALLEAEMQRRGPGVAPRFAVNFETDISPNTHGHWEYLSNGQALWRLRIFSKNAKSLNLGFTKYNMPRGGSLIIYSTDQERVMGPFTPADNEQHEQLWTPVLEGEELVIEVKVPAETKDQLDLELKYVNHDFVGFSQAASGSCNLDVICGAADGWDIVDKYRDIIQSVGVYSINGTLFCTGFLINNTREDCTPYFMTADHCGVTNGNASTVVAYWNFQHSTCRQPNSPESGQNGDGQLNDANMGTILRANWGPSDFALLEFDDPVSETANGFFAGWNVEATAPSDTVIAIHHPSTDEKRISFEFDATFVSEYLSDTPQANGDHITVLDWDIGTTEGGSSGSPLFNNKKQAVGQLHGGWAACGNDDLDSYGWFNASWEGGGTPTTRLKDWLDPDNTGATEMDGRYAMQCNFSVSATPTAQSICAPDNATFTINVSENFQSDVELTINNLPAGLTATFETNPVAPGGTTSLIISDTGGLATGSYSFNVSGTDGTESDDSDLTLNISNGVPPLVGLNTPSNQETEVAIIPTFNWTSITGATYTIEIANDPDFTDIIETANGIVGGMYQIETILEASQVYYWRVKGENICGENDWSAVSSFATAAISCASKTATDLPVTISESGAPTVNSFIEITDGGIINDINVLNIDIDHTWVSDLRIELTSPQGTTIELMNNVFGGSCDENDISISFDDQAANAYAVLDAMCNTTPPALEGTFQPSAALANFANEEAAGIWKLTVLDEANGDGGAINNWELEICTSIPVDNTVTLSENELTTCLTDDAVFEITLGNDFDTLSGVNLSASNLPMGATMTFTPNPAMPGETVNATLSGATETGDFSIAITADDGIQSGQSQLQLSIVDNPPVPNLNTPAQNETGVSINPILSWDAAAGIGEYTVELALDPDFTPANTVSLTASTSLLTLSDLPFCTTYYWRVSASNQCGVSDLSTVFTFTTENDISFETAQQNVTTCNVSVLSVPVQVGPCFEETGIDLTISGLPANATSAFSANPIFSDETLEVEITLNDVAAGSYTVTISGSDGVNDVSTSFTLTVEPPAAAADLTIPANGAIDIDVQPTLVWSAAPNALEYTIDIATDDDFNNIVFTTTQTQTSIALSAALDPLTLYYWRITSLNECGATTSAPFSFTTDDANAVVEIGNFQLEILPNPTSGILQVISTQPLSNAVGLKVFSINGIELMQTQMKKGFSKTTIDLTGYPSGIYLLQLANGSAVKTERIVLK